MDWPDDFCEAAKRLNGEPGDAAQYDEFETEATSQSGQSGFCLNEADVRAGLMQLRAWLTDPRFPDRDKFRALKREAGTPEGEQRLKDAMPLLREMVCGTLDRLMDWRVVMGAEFHDAREAHETVIHQALAARSRLFGHPRPCRLTALKMLRHVKYAHHNGVVFFNQTMDRLREASLADLGLGSGTGAAATVAALSSMLAQSGERGEGGSSGNNGGSDGDPASMVARLMLLRAMRDAFESNTSGDAAREQRGPRPGNSSAEEFN